MAYMLVFVVGCILASSVVGCTWEVDCMLAFWERCMLVFWGHYMVVSWARCILAALARYILVSLVRYMLASLGLSRVGFLLPGALQGWILAPWGVQA